MVQFDEHIFQMGWFNHQLVIVYQAISCISPSIDMVSTK